MYIRHYFESPQDIYQVASSRKFSGVCAQDVFQKKFSLDLIGIFFMHFIGNKNDGYYLVQGLGNIVDGVEETRQNLVYFPACFLLMWLWFIRKSTAFLLFRCIGHFL